MDITTPVTSGSKIKLKGTDKSSYDLAMEFKKLGKLDEAEQILLSSCQPPSTLYNHYHQLFIIWRIFNKQDLKNKKYIKTIQRIKTMIWLNDQMLVCMIKHCHTHFFRTLPAEFFDIFNNFLVSDAETLLKAAEAINDIENLKLAVKLINEFAYKKRLKTTVL